MNHAPTKKIMTHNPEFHHRRSLRLTDYDYSQAGAYFVTVCAWQKKCLFGEVKGGEMLLNKYGEIVKECWDAIAGHFTDVETDEFVVMPNHIHGIITMSNVGAQFIAPFQKPTAEKQGVMAENPGAMNYAPTENNGTNQGVMNRAPTVGDIVRAFKARCTHAINRMRNAQGVPACGSLRHEHDAPRHRARGRSSSHGCRLSCR